MPRLTSREKTKVRQNALPKLNSVSSSTHHKQKKFSDKTPEKTSQDRAKNFKRGSHPPRGYLTIASNGKNPPKLNVKFIAIYLNNLEYEPPCLEKLVRSFSAGFSILDLLCFPIAHHEKRINNFRNLPLRYEDTIAQQLPSSGR